MEQEDEEEEEADEVDEAGEAEAGMANTLPLLLTGLWLPSRGFPATEQAGKEDPAANPAAANINPDTLLALALFPLPCWPDPPPLPLPPLPLDLLFSLPAALLELNPLIIFKSLGDEKQENELLDRADLLSTGLADPPAKSIAEPLE